MSVHKICVVTGTRAEYGLLYWLMKKVQDDKQLQLQTVVTGMHLSPEFGLTYRQIEKDGFIIDEKVEMLLSSDTVVGITKSIGLGVIGFADALQRLKPDLLVVLGDRFEILAAVQAALIARIPVAHLCGGDTTEGAFDESIRHSITKMSHFHFVTNDVAARRVAQLGENPEHVFNVGSTGIDNIRQLQLLDRNELEIQLGLQFRKRNLLITFHPVTLELESPLVQFQELLDALASFGEQTGLIFTMPNADTEGREIINMINEFVAIHDNAHAYVSLGQLRYLSVMSQVDAVVGNSSSGLYEAPSFAIPTVNIGDRQRGRLQAASVINCKPAAGEIKQAIEQALTLDCSGVVNPYGQGGSSEEILNIIKRIDIKAGDILKKQFFDIG